MKKLILFIISFLIISTDSQSQVALEWGKESGGASKVMCLDNAGNVIVAGASDNFSHDNKTIKYRPNGETMWSVNSSTGDGVKDMVTDADGNIYQVGTYYDIDFTTVKYDSLGVQKWVSYYDDPLVNNSNEIAVAVSIDNNRNLLVSGEGNGINTNIDYISVKYDSSGALIWAKRYSGTNGNNVDKVKSNAVDSEGNLYVTGYSYKEGQGYDAVTLKYSSAGNLIWGARYNGPANLDENPVKVIHKSGFVYVCANSRGVDGSWDVAIIKYSASDGFVQWSERYAVSTGSLEFANMMVADNDGNIFLTGTSFTLKYNSSGIKQWVYPNNGAALTLDSDGNIYSTGSSGSDVYTIKLNQFGQLLWTQIIYGFCVEIYCLGYNSNGVLVDNQNNVYVSGNSITGFGGGHTYFNTVKYSQEVSCLVNLNLYLQGFYDSQENKMIKDTVQVYLRSATPPYNFIDTAKGIIDSLGSGRFYFYSLSPDNFYLVVKHRNSIETWSNPFTFTDNEANYTFVNTAEAAFGSNQKRVDESPERYALYGGDVNQDGTIDGSDIILVLNDADNFTSGYVVTDVTGDNFTDATDLILTYNNSANFVSVINP